MDKKVRIGVLGGARGGSMINYCERSDNAVVVAICDKNPEVLETQRRTLRDDRITYYDNFEDFLRHDMDAVVLANYANEHAPFAIRAMRRGLHVFSEVLPCQTMKEAVELIEAVEETGKIYAYGENYCFMPAPYEMKKLYRAGKIGEFEYGEGEYIHNCESIWPSITYGEPDHWRNWVYATFYCTHSLGPIIHITGLRPVSVIGLEGTKNERDLRVGKRSGQFGMEMVTLENGGIVKSIHGELYKNSIWYSVYGSKGEMESSREAAKAGNVGRIYVKADEYSGGYDTEKYENYEPKHGMEDRLRGFGQAARTTTPCITLWKRSSETPMPTPLTSMKQWICTCPECSPTAPSSPAASPWRFRTCATRHSATGGGTMLPAPILPLPEISSCPRSRRGHRTSMPAYTSISDSFGIKNAHAGSWS